MLFLIMKCNDELKKIVLESFYTVPNISLVSVEAIARGEFARVDAIKRCGSDER